MASMVPSFTGMVARQTSKKWQRDLLRYMLRRQLTRSTSVLLALSDHVVLLIFSPKIKFYLSNSGHTLIRLLSVKYEDILDDFEILDQYRKQVSLLVRLDSQGTPLKHVVPRRAK